MTSFCRNYTQAERIHALKVFADPKYIPAEANALAPPGTRYNWAKRAARNLGLDPSQVQAVSAIVSSKVGDRNVGEVTAEVAASFGIDVATLTTALTLLPSALPDIKTYAYDRKTTQRRPYTRPATKPPAVARSKTTAPPTIAEEVAAPPLQVPAVPPEPVLVPTVKEAVAPAKPANPYLEALLALEKTQREIASLLGNQ